MSISKIFMTLIVVVACVVLGAMLLNKVLPNVTAQVSNAIEGMLYRATGISMDFNGDSIYGSTTGGSASKNQMNTNAVTSQNANGVAANVQGYGGV